MKLPPYPHFPQLSDEIVLLRQVLLSDLHDLVSISFYDGKAAASPDEAVEMQEKINRNYGEGDCIHWGIVSRASDKMVGTCGYYRGFKNGTAELGCVLLPDFQGQGFMSRAMQLAIDFGWNEMKLQRIIAITGKQNRQAIKLMESLAFKKTAELEGEMLEYELQASPYNRR